MARAAGSRLRRTEAEGGGEEVGEGRGLVDDVASGVFTGVEDEDGGGVGGELEQGLAACAAGHGSGVIEIGDRDCAQGDRGAEFGDGATDGNLLGAAGEAVAGVFYVAAGDDVGGVWLGEEEGGADAEVAVGGVGVMGGSERLGAQVGEELG